MTTSVLSTKISKVRNKIPDTSGLVVTKNVLNTKINEIENKIAGVSGLIKKIMTLIMKQK